MFKIILSATSDNFTSSFQIWMPFTFFLLYNEIFFVLARTSSTLLAGCGNTRIFAWFLILDEKLPPWNMMFMVGFSTYAFCN